MASPAPEARGKRKYSEVVRFTHFDRSRRPKHLTVLAYESVINDKGFAEEGNYLIVIDDGRSKAMFGLSEAEACQLVKWLDVAITENAKNYQLNTELALKQRKARKAGEGTQPQDAGFEDEEGVDDLGD